MNSGYPFSRVFDVNSGGIVRMTIQILKRTIVASRRRDSIGNLAARNKSTISRSIRKIPAISTKSNQMAKRFESFLDFVCFEQFSINMDGIDLTAIDAGRSGVQHLGNSIQNHRNGSVSSVASRSDYVQDVVVASPAATNDTRSGGFTGFFTWNGSR